MRENICELFSDKKMIPNCKRDIIFMEARLGNSQKCETLPEKTKCLDIFKTQKVKNTVREKLAAFYIPDLLKNIGQKDPEKEFEGSFFDTTKIKPKSFLKKEGLTVQKN